MQAILSNNSCKVAMHVSLEIPEDLGRRIAADPGELPRAALEALALEGIRAGKLTVSQARRLLGIPSRYEMDGFLKAHGVYLDLTLDDVRRESEVARALPG
jgi:hypothetical protein